MYYKGDYDNFERVRADTRKQQHKVLRNPISQGSLT